MRRWQKLSWKLGLVVIGVMCLSLGMASQARAQTTADITITASGFVVGAPGGFTITYVSDYEVQLDWTMGPLAVNTMVRAAYGHPPANILDGYEVYRGPLATATDDSISLAGPDIIYYRAWSEDATGFWNVVEFAEADTGDIMSASFLFIGILSIAGILTWLCATRRNVLLSLTAGLVWFALAMWIFFSATAPFDLADNYVKILAWVFFCLTFLPLVLYMNVKITKTDKKGNSWSEYGDVPEERESPYEKYARDLHARMYRHRKQRRLL